VPACHTDPTVEGPLDAICPTGAEPRFADF